MQSYSSQSPAKKKPSIARAAALVFLGGACYGFNATCYKSPTPPGSAPPRPQRRKCGSRSLSLPHS